jgi:1,4-dihydroxy-2-naphthoate octaprenyltransferase
VAGLAGLTLVVLSQLWWLLAVGAFAIAAAWTYTGGPRPYGYAGWGEVFVFVFFGLVAVCGTAVVQVGHISALAWLCGAGVGSMVCAILVVNNLRDIPGDAIAGKRTLAVRLGDQSTRLLYTSMIAIGLAVPLLVAILSITEPYAWPLGAVLGLASGIVAVPPLRTVQGGAKGPALVPALVATGKLVLAHGVLLSAGIAASALLS